MRRVSSGHSKWAGAVSLSLVIHAALSLLVHHRSAAAATSPVVSEPEPVRDAMIGDTLELLTDVSLDAEGAARPTLAAAEPSPPPAAAEPAQPPAAAHHDEPSPKTAPAPSLAIERPKAADQEPVRKPRPAPKTERPATKAPARDASPKRKSVSAAASSSVAVGASASPPSSGASGSFGTAGQPTVRHLGRAFTHAIMPVGMTDPVWNQLPVGDGGTLEIVLSVDAEGKITGFEPVGERPPAHLLKLVKNVLWTLKSGRFAFDGEQPSSGRQTLKLQARLSDVDANSVEGGRIDAGYSFSGTRGVAPFTLHGGRHVEIGVQVLKLER